MRAIKRFPAIAALTTCAAGLVLFGACGGDSEPEADEPSATEAESPDAASDPTNPAGSDDGDDQATADLAIPDTTWTRVWGHLEITGDVTRSLDAEGEGVTIDGLTNANMNVTGTTAEILNFTVDNTGFGGLTVTLGDISTIASYPDGCDLQLLETSQSRTHFYLKCDSLDAVSTSSTDTYTISIEGDVALEA